MNIHLLDLFALQFNAELANKVKSALDIGMTCQEVTSYCIKSSSKLINELPKFYLKEKNQNLFNDLVAQSPFVTTSNIFSDIDLRTSGALRNGKYFVHAIYGVKQIDLSKIIKRPSALTMQQASNLWYISGSIILILIHSLINDENSLTDFMSVVKEEVEASKGKKTFSSFYSWFT